MIVRPAHPSHYGWLQKRIDIQIGPDFRAIEAVDGEGRVHGMVGFGGWTQNAASMHFALDNPAALRSLLRPAFGIVFQDFGKGLAVATVLSTNERSLAVVPRIGFRETYRIRDGWDVGVDLVLFEMRRNECRWIAENAAKEAA